MNIYTRTNWIINMSIVHDGKQIRNSGLFKLKNDFGFM